MSHLTIFNQSNYKPQFQNAYEYLNSVKLEIRGLKSAIDLKLTILYVLWEFQNSRIYF
jgi:hypothetical protein